MKSQSNENAPRNIEEYVVRKVLEHAMQENVEIRELKKRLARYEMQAAICCNCENVSLVNFIHGCTWCRKRVCSSCAEKNDYRYNITQYAFCSSMCRDKKRNGL